MASPAPIEQVSSDTDQQITLIDSDVHNYPNGIEDLTPHMSRRWQAYIEQSGMKLPGASFYPKVFREAARRDAFPPSGKRPGGDPDFAREQLLDAWGIDLAILNPLIGLTSVFNLDLGNAIMSAANDWTQQDWLESDPRWYASIVVNPLDPIASAAEIRRLAGNPRFVQVLLLVRSPAPYGRRQFHPIFEAARGADLPVGIHFGGSGNPITAVGLANYNSKIHSWFRTPDSLRECLESSKPWDTPARDEEVEIPEDVEASITDTLRGAYFGLCGEIIDAGLISIADFDMALSLSLDMKPAFTFMNQLGTAEALRLVQNFADANPGFPVPKCIAERGLNNEPFNIPVIMRKDVDGIATLTIRRPKVLNALSHSVYNELRQHFSDIEEDASIRASVLTGYGKKAFVSGADVRFLAKIETVEDGERTASSSNEVMSFIENLNKPVVCAMNGLAFGGGNELAMSCTIRIAQKGLRVLAGQPEPNLGIIPGAGGTQRLPRIIGLEKAAELLRTGRPISSAEALALGLISEEVDGDLVERARDIAQDLADGKLDSPGIRREPLDNVPSALPEVDLGHLSKKVDEILCKAILGGAGMVLTDALAFEVVCFGEVCGTKDMRIGVDNFIRNGPRARAEFTHS